MLSAKANVGIEENPPSLYDDDADAVHCSRSSELFQLRLVSDNEWEYAANTQSHVRCSNRSRSRRMHSHEHPNPCFKYNICHKYLYTHTRPRKPTVEWTTMAQGRRAMRTNGKQPARKRTAKCWWRSNWIKESLCTVNSMWQRKIVERQKLNGEENFLSWHAKWCGNVENPVHSLMRWRLVVLRHVTRQTHPRTDTHTHVAPLSSNWVERIHA